MSKHRSFRWLAAVVCWFAVAGTARAEGRPHPHFNDQGTLTWYTSMREAVAAARAEDKVILVEYGRLRCTQCRVLCCKVLPHPDVRARLSSVAVGLACDCDEPEPAVDQLLRRNLPRANALPFVGFLRSDGRWITGFAGCRTVEQFCADLCAAERALAEDRCARQRLLAARAPVKPAPSAAKTATAPPALAAAAPAPAPAPAAPAKPAPEAPASPRVLAAFPAPAEAPPVVPPAAQTPPAAATPCESPPVACAVETAPEVATAVVEAAPAPSPCVAAVVAAAAPAETAPAVTTCPRTRAEAAAERGAWCEVIHLCRGTERPDPTMEALEERARAWARERLDGALTAIEERRFDDAAGAIGVVRQVMRGEPEEQEAARGLEAIRHVRRIGELDDAGSDERASVRHDAREGLRGTRWSRLFDA
jgi:hypothetical protein